MKNKSMNYKKIVLIVLILSIEVYVDHLLGVSHKVEKTEKQLIKENITSKEIQFN